MDVTALNVLTAVIWAGVAAIVTWFVTWPLRRRSVGALLLSLTLTCTAASGGAMLGAVHAMLLPMGHEIAALIVTVAAGALTAFAAVATARRLGREHAVLEAAVADLRRGDAPRPNGPRLSADIERVRHQLQSTAAELADSRDRERALERSRRELVAWMSHDLRTPLAGLRAIAEALEDGVSEEPEKYYKQIGSAVDRLNTMVDDLFDLSRIQAGSPGRLRAVVSVTGVADDVTEALVPLAAARAVVLTRRADSVPDSLPREVRGDAGELNRALTNLIANAVRHTGEGGRVIVTVRTQGSEVHVDVEDECGGIAADVLPRVFDVGFRGAAARPADADSGGAGLGLAITRGIVEAHHGRVTAVNTERGCRFRMSVPRI